ncbi:MAG: helix-turn-helix domain-containing protein [Chloroflexi bacterium]|nr:helix-turn-helix domain-containing protein [Chloroflexota bacterium]
MESTMLTVPEAAQELRIGRDRAYQLVRTGRLPSIRVSRTIRVPRQALLLFIERELQAQDRKLPGE